MSYEPITVPPSRGPNRGFRTVLIVVAIVLVLCCGGGTVAGFVLFRTGAELGPARETTVGYLDALRAGNYPGAYARLCARARERTSQDEFTRVQSAQPRISDYEIVGLNLSRTNRGVGGTASVRLTRQGGGELTQMISLVKEGDHWRVCP
ncbi:hypothetical protein AB0J86_26770 [Micromonospora sp. NPDC049559]|uniref:Rv0361 family membrane protein n=1 Tax=Micromonospora sp. NPDC049559 TaxID=3155923 RepID=UPI003427EC66